MSRLQKVIKESSRISDERPNTVKIEIPLYNRKGKDISVTSLRKRKKIIATMFIVTGLLCIIYLPALIHSLFSKKTDAPSDYTVNLDTAAIKLSSDYFSSHPSEDFDGDGIDNSKENLEGCNPWDIDTDKDGATDYYEMYVSKTSPSSYDGDIIENEQIISDTNENKNASTPYNMGNVLLWADDYASKASGSVVETLYGYRFENFSGYAQFPNIGKYAYSVNDGVHTLLDYKDDEDVWRIDKNITYVEIFDEELTPVVEYGFLGKTVHANANIFTRFCAAILPSYGILTAELKTDIDINSEDETDILADIAVPEYDLNNPERFANNNIFLSDLSFVREQLLNNKCVAVSLFDINNGEYVGIVYGYTQSGLLIADPYTMTYTGTIEIKEYGRKLLEQEGTFVYYTYYDWSGLGFSSDKYNRISFFAVAG